MLNRFIQALKAVPESKMVFDVDSKVFVSVPHSKIAFNAFSQVFKVIFNAQVDPKNSKVDFENFYSAFLLEMEKQGKDISAVKRIKELSNVIMNEFVPFYESIPDVARAVRSTRSEWRSFAFDPPQLLYVLEKFVPSNTDLELFSAQLISLYDLIKTNPQAQYELTNYAQAATSLYESKIPKQQDVEQKQADLKGINIKENEKVWLDNIVLELRKKQTQIDNEVKVAAIEASDAEVLYKANALLRQETHSISRNSRRLPKQVEATYNKIVTVYNNHLSELEADLKAQIAETRKSDVGIALESPLNNHVDDLDAIIKRRSTSELMKNTAIKVKAMRDICSTFESDETASPQIYAQELRVAHVKIKKHLKNPGVRAVRDSGFVTFLKWGAFIIGSIASLGVLSETLESCLFKKPKTVTNASFALNEIEKVVPDLKQVKKVYPNEYGFKSEVAKRPR